MLIILLIAGIYMLSRTFSKTAFILTLVQVAFVSLFVVFNVMGIFAGVVLAILLEVGILALETKEILA